MLVCQALSNKLPNLMVELRVGSDLDIWLSNHISLNFLSHPLSCRGAWDSKCSCSESNATFELDLIFEIHINGSQPKSFINLENQLDGP